MPEPPEQSRPWDALPKWPRRAITAWLIVHLVAIVSGPASVTPASQLARSTWSVCRPYLQLLYLNHGYHYFAPNPGESTLLSYTAERADGSRVRGTIPHRDIWPRLLYHRHFMLTESLAFVAGVSDARLATEDIARHPDIPSTEDMPAELEEVSLTDAVSDQQLRENAGEMGTAHGHRETPPELRGLLRDWYQSFADCLLTKHDAKQIELTRVVHYLPEIEWMQDSIARGEPLTLREPASFAEFPIGTFDRGTFDRRGPQMIDQPATDEGDQWPLDRPSTDNTDLVLTPSDLRGQP